MTKPMAVSFVPCRGYQINDGQRMVAIVPFTDEQAGRDAALLAASHDLLVALTRTLDELVGGREAVDRDTAILQARAALTKAKGTQP